MSGGNGLCGRLAARLHSGEWEVPQYKRLKQKLLGVLKGEVIEIGPVADEHFELPTSLGIALPHISGTATK